MDPSVRSSRDEDAKDAGDGISGLKQIVSQTLEAKGVLGTIRAQLRAAVFTALDDQEKKVGVHLENPRVAALNTSPQGRLLNALLHEYFEFYDLDNTLSVFMPETNASPEAYQGRAELAKLLGIESRQEAKQEAPLLLDLLSDRLKAAVLQGPGSGLGLGENPMQMKLKEKDNVKLQRKSLSPELPVKDEEKEKEKEKEKNRHVQNQEQEGLQEDNQNQRQTQSEGEGLSVGIGIGIGTVSQGTCETLIESISVSEESGAVGADSINSGSISLPSQGPPRNYHHARPEESHQDDDPHTVTTSEQQPLPLPLQSGLDQEDAANVESFSVDPPNPGPSSSGISRSESTAEASMEGVDRDSRGNVAAAGSEATDEGVKGVKETGTTKAESPLTGDSEDYESDFDEGAPSIIESIAESLSVEEFEEYDAGQAGKPEVQSLEINIADLNEEVKEP